MAGIAIIVKDMSFADSNLGQVTFAGQTIPITALGFGSISSNVPLNASTLTLSVVYTPSNTTQRGVTWSITSGGTYATINQSGVVTLRNLVANAQFTVKVESTADATIYATKTFTVVSTNMIGTIKDGYKVNTSTGEWVADSNFISTDWIDVENVSFAILDLETTVAAANQVGGSVTDGNCKLVVYFEDNAGNYHSFQIANNFVSSSGTPVEGSVHPLILPVREMKKIALASYSDGSTGTGTILKCKLSDWQSATLVVGEMKSSGTETYDSDILNTYAYSTGSSSSATMNTSNYVRSTAATNNQYMTMIKSGESVSVKTKTSSGGNSRAWSKWTLDGVKIGVAEQGADYTETAYTFTADQDMFLIGSCLNSNIGDFELVITKPS